MSRDKRQFWHDFILGIHHRSIRCIDDGERSSWSDAGKAYYGEKYTDIYDVYNDALITGKIDE